MHQRVRQYLLDSDANAPHRDNVQVLSLGRVHVELEKELITIGRIIKSMTLPALYFDVYLAYLTPSELTERPAHKSKVKKRSLDHLKQGTFRRNGNGEFENVSLSKPSFFPPLPSATDSIII